MFKNILKYVGAGLGTVTTAIVSKYAGSEIGIAAGSAVTLIFARILHVTPAPAPKQ